MTSTTAAREARADGIPSGRTHREDVGALLGWAEWLHEHPLAHEDLPPDWRWLMRAAVAPEAARLP